MFVLLAEFKSKKNLKRKKPNHKLLLGKISIILVIII